MHAAEHHVINLSVPLDVRHASTVRLIASSVAADAGLSVDDIDDFRLGINEVVSVLADEPVGTEGRLLLAFTVSTGSVDATVSRTDGAGAAELDELARRILDAVVDRHEYSRGSFRLTKTASGRNTSDGD
ncbi:MAG: hypothetical protein WEB78_10065 [Ilumatobacteraceae bacterium]